ncbi:uncharacterized protein LOC118678954 [Myotis myotis]|uniref:uncharacterized protein LOC118678954 n=1 Tax=Myotis myotis TaxID=51298 RepID=UPI00174A950B|nr:uncharacterized protein LOC118678954 [Myotis myotis]
MESARLCYACRMVFGQLGSPERWGEPRALELNPWAASHLRLLPEAAQHPRGRDRLSAALTQSPVGGHLLPSLALPPGRAGFQCAHLYAGDKECFVTPPTSHGCYETTVCSENTLSNLGKGAHGSGDAAAPDPGRPAVPTRHPVTTSPAPGKGGANQPTSCAVAPDEAHGVCGFRGWLTHRFQQRTSSAGPGRGHRVPGERETSLPTGHWTLSSPQALLPWRAGRGAGRDPQAAGTVDAEAGESSEDESEKSPPLLWRQRRLPRAPIPSLSAPTGKSRAQQHGLHRRGLPGAVPPAGAWTSRRSTRRGTCCPLLWSTVFQALAGVAQWTECWPVDGRVSGLIPVKGTCPGCGLGPW